MQTFYIQTFYMNSAIDLSDPSKPLKSLTFRV